MIGPPRVPSPDYVPTVADLLSEMDRLHIDASIVRHRTCLDVAPYTGNDVLMEQISSQDRLIPAWFVTPDGREPDFDPETLVAHMLAAGVKVAWTDPASEDFIFQGWLCRRLFGALAEARIPLVVEYGKVNLSDIHGVLSEFPGLRLILTQIPRLGRNRKLEPLLELHPELYLCFGPSFSVPGYWPDLCRRYGDHRWIWGSGYPDMEGGAGISGLVYSGLTGEQMNFVAHGNIERLLSEVRI